MSANTSSLPFDERTCITFLLREERLRGTGGLLYVKGDEWAYVHLKPGMFPERIFEQLTSALEQDANQHFFIIVQDGTQCTTYMYDRVLAAQRAVEWMAVDEVTSQE